MVERKYNVSICMQATSMFEDVKLYDEISCAIEQEMNEGCFVLEGISKEELAKITALDIDIIMRCTKYNKEDLTVSNCDWDTGELNIYFNIPVLFNITLLRYNYLEKEMRIDSKFEMDE